jgi:hypothetical protein
MKGRNRRCCPFRTPYSSKPRRQAETRIEDQFAGRMQVRSGIERSSHRRGALHTSRTETSVHHKPEGGRRRKLQPSKSPARRGDQIDRRCRARTQCRPRNLRCHCRDRLDRRAGRGTPACRRRVSKRHKHPLGTPIRERSRHCYYTVRPRCTRGCPSQLDKVRNTAPPRRSRRDRTVYA